MNLHPEYLIDDQGNKESVLISILEWNQILDALEDLDDIKNYDAIKTQPSDAIPFDQAVQEIKQGTV